MKIEEFISQLESSDAYQNNEAVRKHVSESRQTLLDLAHGNDRDAFMAELMKFNGRLDLTLNPSAPDPRKTELIGQLNLAGQYENCVDTLGLFGLLNRVREADPGDAPVPTVEQVLGTFTTEMLELATTFQEPTLLLVPETSFAAKVKALNDHKTLHGQEDIFVGYDFTDPVNHSNRISGWRASIVEGPREMNLKMWDSPGLPVGERVDKRFLGNRKLGEKSMDRHLYAMLLMENLKDGKILDSKTVTLLSDDPAGWDSKEPMKPFAKWEVVHHLFGTTEANEVRPNARFRSSVGGDVLLNAVESSESLEKFNLEEQYPKRLQTLATFGFFDSETLDSFSIVGIDGRKYPIPDIYQVRARLTPEKLKLIEEHIKNPTLLIVPFAMPLKTIVKRIESKEGLIPKHNLLKTEWDIESDIPGGESEERIFYFPISYDTVGHSGLTKSQMMDPQTSLNSFPGWQVLVVDGTESVPKSTLNKSAIKLKAEFDAKGLSGLTPEDWLMLHAEGIRKGVPFDNCLKKSVSLLLASYLRKGNGAPSAYWNGEDKGGVELYVGPADDPIDNTGTRPAVRL